MNFESTFKTFILCQLLELTTVAFRATKILSTVGGDFPAEHSFQGYQNTVKSRS